MTADETRSVPGLEDILSSAVERQVAEQRALQEALSGIRDAVDGLRHDLADRGDAAPDRVEEVIEELRGDLTKALGDGPPDTREELAALRDALEEVRALVSGTAREIREIPQSLPETPSGLPLLVERLEERIDALPAALFKGVRDALAPQFEVPSELKNALDELRTEFGRNSGATSLGPALDEITGSVETATRDVQALAQAMLDLNAGLREWAGEIENRISALAEALVEGLRDLAGAQKESLESLGAAVTSSTGDLRKEVRGIVRDTTRSLGTRLDGVQEELVQAGQLSKYLRDQSEDLDRALAGLGDVPQRLEGVVAQALRRALTVRAGLMKEAENALEGIIGPVEENLDRLVNSLETVSEVFEDEHLDEDLRRISLHQVELTGRVDDLQEALLQRLEDLEEERSRRELILAEAIDRAAKGLEPRAAEELAAQAGAAKKAAKKPASKAAKTSQAKTKTKAAKKPAAKKAAKKAAPKKTTATRTAKKGNRKASARRSGRRSRAASEADRGSEASGDRTASGKPSRDRVRTTTRTRNFIPV